MEQIIISNFRCMALIQIRLRSLEKAFLALAGQFYYFSYSKLVAKISEIVCTVHFCKLQKYKNKHIVKIYL